MRVPGARPQSAPTVGAHSRRPQSAPRVGAQGRRPGSASPRSAAQGRRPRSAPQSAPEHGAHVPRTQRRPAHTVRCWNRRYEGCVVSRRCARAPSGCTEQVFGAVGGGLTSAPPSGAPGRRPSRRPQSAPGHGAYVPRTRRRPAHTVRCWNRRYEGCVVSRRCARAPSGCTEQVFGAVGGGLTSAPPSGAPGRRPRSAPRSGGPSRRPGTERMCRAPGGGPRTPCVAGTDGTRAAW